MNKSAAKIKPVSLDELLGVGSGVSGGSREQEGGIMEIPLDELHPFKNHPFLVKDDEKMAETVDSIKTSGILVPGIVRIRKEGGYEIIAGHRRCRGAQLAGLRTMPVVIKELSDAEAAVIMVDSNIQREDLTYREKAFAYKMKYDALKEMGLDEREAGKRIDDAFAEKMGESRSRIQRYIRLTCLKEEILDMVQEKRLGFIAGTDISYLTGEEQDMLLRVMRQTGAVPSGAQAVKLKEYSREGKLNEAVMELLLQQEKKTGQLVLKAKRLKNYFPDSYDLAAMEEVIFQLLDDWKQNQT